VPDGRELLAIIETPSEEAEPSVDNPFLEAEIIRVNALTGTQTPVTKLFIETGETDIWPSVIWAPNDMIIFNSFDLEYLGKKEPPLLLYAWSLQEQRRIRLTEAPAPTEVPAFYMLPTLSPSGSKLAYLKVWEDGEINKGFELFRGFHVPGPTAYLSEIYVLDLDSGEQQRIAGPSAPFQPFWVSETKLGYAEFAENAATIWIQDLEKRTRRNLSSDLKTRFWEERLRAAQVQLQELKEAAALAGSEKLQDQLTEKEAHLQELEEERRTQQDEIKMLKQRLEDQENEIASLQGQVEAQRTSVPRLEIILAISIALVLLWRIFF